MAMTNRNNIKKDCFIMATIDELVPQDHLVRKLESCIDFTFIYPKVKSLYSDMGRPSIDPVVLFKMIFINIKNIFTKKLLTTLNIPLCLNNSYLL